MGAFWRAVPRHGNVAQLREAALHGRLGEWLTSLTVVVVAGCGSLARPLPVAVFVLANSRDDVRIACSPWKVLCVRAKMRVVFC
jgi:hypothetical protein